MGKVPLPVIKKFEHQAWQKLSRPWLALVKPPLEVEPQPDTSQPWPPK